MWLKDPVSKVKSVSLTFALLSFIGYFIANALVVAGQTKDPASFGEMFFMCISLYFGRRADTLVNAMKGTKSVKKEKEDESEA